MFTKDGKKEVAKRKRKHHQDVKNEANSLNVSTVIGQIVPRRHMF